MPEFDRSRLSVRERIVWLKRDGAAGVTALFATIVRAVGISRPERRRSVAITATILATYYDVEESTPVGILLSSKHTGWSDGPSALDR